MDRKKIETVAVTLLMVGLVTGVAVYFTAGHFYNVGLQEGIGLNKQNEPTTDLLPRPDGPLGYLTYLNLCAVLAIGCMATAVMFYVQRIEPKKVKGSTELKLKSGVRTVSKKTSAVGRRTRERLKGVMPIVIAPAKDKSRKKTVKKRKKKGKVHVRKRTGKPRGKTYTKPKGDSK
jgi:hypothetical protein